MSFEKVVSHAIEAYKTNVKLISFFSIPLIVAFPLLLLLPNYASLGGIFLRFNSIGTDVSSWGVAYMLVVLLISLILFSFAIVAINSVIKAQRAMLSLKHADVERMEDATFRLFGLLLLVFLALFAFNLLLFEMNVGERLRLVLNGLFSLAASMLVLFAPQAIVIDNAKIEHAISLSVSVLVKKPALVVAFLTLGALLVLVNSFVFTSLQGVWGMFPYVAIVVNSLLIVPFLEVVKTQIYLTKYSLL